MGEKKSRLRKGGKRGLTKEKKFSATSSDNERRGKGKRAHSRCLRRSSRTLSVGESHWGILRKEKDKRKKEGKERKARAASIWNGEVDRSRRLEEKNRIEKEGAEPTWSRGEKGLLPRSLPAQSTLTGGKTKTR